MQTVDSVAAKHPTFSREYTYRQIVETITLGGIEYEMRPIVSADKVDERAAHDATRTDLTSARVETIRATMNGKVKNRIPQYDDQILSVVIIK